MSEMWTETKTDVRSYDWRGHPILLKDVPALRNSKTKQIRVYPAEVAKAEIVEIAKKYGLEPRDVATLLVIFAKPGIFNAGEVFYNYHINKMLFYQWQEATKVGIPEALPHDEFEQADRGPVPKHIEEDLDRLSHMGLLKTEYHRWGEGAKQQSKGIFLIEKGMDLGLKLWNEVPAPFTELSSKVKDMIFPMSPGQVKKKVHREFPEYRKGYTKEDTA